MPDYTPEQQEAGQRIMIREGLFGRAMESLIGGVILAGFALALGANDVEIGLVAAIPFLAHLVHLPAIPLMARMPDRRALTIRSAYASRSVLFLIALVPLVALPFRSIDVLIALYIVYALIANLSAAAWQVWVRDLVPRERLGAYFGRRMAILSAVGLVVTLAAGQFVTYWRTSFPERATAVFAIIFALGGIMGIIGTSITRTAPVVPAEPSNLHLKAMLKEPLQDKNFRRVLVFLAAWGFAANFSLPFISIVMLKTLGYSISVVVLFAALSTAANIFALKLWSRVTDVYGNKPVLALGASVSIVAILAWGLIPKEPGLAVLLVAGLVHVLLGISAAAMDLGSNNLVMKLAPQEDGPAYLSTASVAKSVATGVAPLLGGVVAALLVNRAVFLDIGWTGPSGEHVITALRFAHYDFLFFVSALLGLYALHRLLGFEEQGEAPPVEVARALRREVGQVSSVAGMRQFAHLASYLVEAAYRFERSLDPRRALGDDGDEEKGPKKEKEDGPTSRRAV